MSEIPTYPNECPHKEIPERCWTCLQGQLKESLNGLTTALSGKRKPVMTPEEEAAMIQACTPGIRRTVKWLRELGFNTTDSGDGVTNVAAGMEGAFEEPMVVVVPQVDDAVSAGTQAKMIIFALGARGVFVDGSTVRVELTISFRSEPHKFRDGYQTVTTILILGVDDEKLFGPMLKNVVELEP